MKTPTRIPRRYSRFFEAVPHPELHPDSLSNFDEPRPRVASYDPESHGVGSRRPVNLSWHPEQMHTLSGAGDDHGEQEPWDIEKHGISGPEIDHSLAVTDPLVEEGKAKVKSTVHKLMLRTKNFRDLIEQGMAIMGERGRENLWKAPFKVPVHLVVHVAKTFWAFVNGLAKFTAMILDLVANGIYYITTCLAPMAVGRGHSKRCNITGKYVLSLLGQFARAPRYFATFGVVMPLILKKGLAALLGLLAAAGLFHIDPHDQTFFYTIITASCLYKLTGQYLHGLHDAIGKAIHDAEKEIGEEASRQLNPKWYAWYEWVEEAAPEIFAKGWQSLAGSPVLVDTISTIRSVANYLKKPKPADASGGEHRPATEEEAMAAAEEVKAELSQVSESGDFSAWMLKRHPEFLLSG